MQLWHCSLVSCQLLPHVSLGLTLHMSTLIHIQYGSARAMQGMLEILSRIQEDSAQCKEAKHTEPVVLLLQVKDWEAAPNSPLLRQHPLAALQLAQPVARQAAQQSVPGHQDRSRCTTLSRRRWVRDSQ